MKRLKGRKIQYNSAYNTVKLHHTDHLARKDAAVMKTAVKVGEIVNVGKIPTFDDYYNTVYKLGMEQMIKDPSKIKPSDLVAAENAKTAKERLQLQTDALQLVAAKFFSGITATNARGQIETTDSE